MIVKNNDLKSLQSNDFCLAVALKSMIRDQVRISFGGSEVIRDPSGSEVIRELYIPKTSQKTQLIKFNSIHLILIPPHGVYIRSNSALVTRSWTPSSSSSSSSSSANFFAFAAASHYSCSSNRSSCFCLRCFLVILSSLKPPPFRSSLAKSYGKLSKKPLRLGIVGSSNFIISSFYG